MHLRHSSVWFCKRVDNISNNPLWNTFKGSLSPKGCENEKKQKQKKNKDPSYNIKDIYVISWVTQPFWLVLTNDLLQDWCIGGITTNNALLLYCIKKKKKTIRFHFSVGLFSNRSQKTSKFGKKIRDTLSCTLCANSGSYHILTSSAILYWTA